MSAALMEAQLLGMLRVDPDLSARGCKAERQAIGGIAITHREHHLGLWAWQVSLFTFTPGGYGAPSFKIETAVEALIYTRNVVCPARS